MLTALSKKHKLHIKCEKAKDGMRQYRWNYAKCKDVLFSVRYKYENSA